MCAALGKGDNEYWLHVADLQWSEVHLERRTPVPGYCLVVWKDRHVAEPTELTDQEASGYWQDVLTVGRGVQAAFHPLKVNYMMLGNTLPHLHTHVVPRYARDPAPAGPIPWDVVFSSPPAPESELRIQAETLRHRLS